MWNSDFNKKDIKVEGGLFASKREAARDGRQDNVIHA
jgi:hypothetical protein